MRLSAWLLLVGLLCLPVAVMAGEGPSSCDTELTFYQRYSQKIEKQRDGWLQRAQLLEMEKSYLKQRIEELEKTKAEPPK